MLHDKNICKNLGIFSLLFVKLLLMFPFHKKSSKEDADVDKKSCSIRPSSIGNQVEARKLCVLRPLLWSDKIRWSFVEALIFSWWDLLDLYLFHHQRKKGWIWWDEDRRIGGSGIDYHRALRLSRLLCLPRHHDYTCSSGLASLSQLFAGFVFCLFTTKRTDYWYW